MTMGSLNPLEVFPLEVWKMIFEQLGGQQGSSTNLFNCSKVCSEFENLLKPTQSQWVFETVFPLIFPYMERKQILACRRVCKEWCRVVDSFLEDFETRRPFNSKDTTNISNSFLCEDDILDEKGLDGTHLDSVENLNEFMRNMKNSKNPFIGGLLQLNDPDSSADPEPDREINNDELPGLDAVARERRQNLFWKKVSEFLVMFGERVKYMKLTSYNSHPVNAMEFYEFLRQYLICLPNIKGLNVSGRFSYFEEDSADSKENCRRLRQVKELLGKDTSSLPEISSLESIEMLTFGLPRCMYEKLIVGINPRKLKCLKLCVNRLSVEGIIMTLNEPLPSLTELHLVGVKSFEHLQNLLTNLISEGAPLGKFKVYFEVTDTESASTKINFDLVCEAISKYGRTLQMLSVSGFGFHETLTELPNPTLSMLKIPHVRSLELDSLTFGPGPEFLPPNFAQSLEYLIIKISDPDEGIALFRRQGPGTEFYKGAVDGELCYSTIWSKMPKLKGIKVRFPYIDKAITCTKEMHERGVRSAALSIDEFVASSESDGFNALSDSDEFDALTESD